MDNREQRIVIKYFFLKGWGYKKITTELTDTLEDDALSMSTIQRWVNRFKSGDLSCNDLEREGRRNLDTQCVNVIREFPRLNNKSDRSSQYFYM